MHNSQCSIDTRSGSVYEIERDTVKGAGRSLHPGVVDTLRGKGDAVSQLCSQLGGMDRHQSERLLRLEEENLVLKKQLNDCMLEIQALQDVLKNSW
ncbi:MAG: hypothetical protein EP334_04985 [Gammaproteobacteria bacterium]|nr:MAG: hypothetical protein EP334_04985 [Gammaproteobacteria bacterium]